MTSPSKPPVSQLIIGWSFIFFLAAIIGYFAASWMVSPEEEETPEISIGNIHTLDQGKQWASVKISNFESRYQELCGMKRNDQLKDKFNSLINNVRWLVESCHKIEGLSTQEQSALFDWIMDDLKSKHPELYQLSISDAGTIPCW